MILTPSVRIAFIAIACVLPSAAGAQGSGVGCVSSAPPKPLVDSKSHQPSPAAIYLPGFYRNEYGTWRWNHGNWATPPAGAQSWEPAKWAHSSQGYCFVPGYWK